MTLNTLNGSVVSAPRSTLVQTVDEEVAAIERTFQSIHNSIRHPTKKHLTVASSQEILPDYIVSLIDTVNLSKQHFFFAPSHTLFLHHPQNWCYEFLYGVFDADPRPKKAKGATAADTELVKQQVERALLVGTKRTSNEGPHAGPQVWQARVDGTVDTNLLHCCFTAAGGHILPADGGIDTQTCRIGGSRQRTADRRRCRERGRTAGGEKYVLR